MNTLLANTPTQAEPKPSLPELLGELTGQMVTLGKQEIQLAKSELRMTAKKTAVDSAGILGGGILIHAGLLALISAAAAGLATIMPLWTALLVVAAVLCFAGALTVRIGLAKLEQDSHLNHLPKSLEQNKNFIKEKMA